MFMIVSQAITIRKKGIEILVMDDPKDQPSFDPICFRVITVEDYLKTQRLKAKVLAELAALQDILDKELRGDHKRI